MNIDGVDAPILLTVEVCLKATSNIDPQLVHEAVKSYLADQATIPNRDGPIDFSNTQDPTLINHVEKIVLGDTDSSKSWQQQLFKFQYVPQIHVYQLDEDGPEEDDEGVEDGVPSYRSWVLPSRELDGLWGSLLYDTDVKQRLVRYATSALVFSDAGVDPQLISWNRVVFLHGPPGTGKTSLCKAVAQKLTIKLGSRYSRGELVEINAHSLFSKWFSESGKLVSRLFTKIGELVAEEDVLLFVLIDEVESLTSARKAAVSGSEPSDAVRAVNALLTQLDALKRYPNVMVLTTSNLTEAIDTAFMDRADIKAYIGPPTEHARYEILRSSVQELSRAGIIAGQQGSLLQRFPEVASSTLSGDMDTGGVSSTSGSEASQLSHMLRSVAVACEGVSGRALRKLPFLAHATSGELPSPCSMMQFLQAMMAAAGRERSDRAALTAG